MLTDELVRDDISRHWMSRCWQAASNSNDPSTNNGAVVVDRWGVGAPPACNSVGPDFDRETVAAMDRDAKLQYVVHAEINAVVSAARTARISPVGGTLHVLWYACVPCASVIRAAGITRVVGLKRHYDGTPDRWRAAVDAGIRHLAEAGIECQLYDGPIDADCEILFNRKVWTP